MYEYPSIMHICTNIHTHKGGNAMKKIIVMIISILLLCTLVGCSNDEKEILQTIDKYISACNENDMTTMYECYDPDIQTASEGITNSVGNYFGINNAYDTGLALGGILQNAMQTALQDITGIEFEYEYKRGKTNSFDLSDNNCKIDIMYDFIFSLPNYDSNIDVETLLSFDMIKKDNSWYISNVVEEAITTDEEIQEILSDVISDINKEKIEKAKAKGLTQLTRDARVFSNDKAWVSGEEIGAEWACIDTNGKVLFTLENNMYPVSDFNNNVALIFNDKDEDNLILRLINEKGEEIANFDGCELLASGDTTFMLRKKVDVFEGKWEEVGIINSSGEWIIPLSREHAFIDVDYYNRVPYSINHCGSDIYGMFDGYSSLIYNGLTGETIGEIDFNLRYYDDYAAAHYYDEDYNEYNCLIDTSGQITKEFKFEDIGYNTSYGIYSDGLLYLEDTNKFYDYDGKIKIDLSKYDVDTQYNLPYFKDGYSAILFDNGYITIINTNGDFMFEPRKAYDISTISEGIVGYACEDNWIYIDMNGNELFQCEYESLEFNNGYALVESEDGYFYIDKNGDRLY